MCNAPHCLLSPLDFGAAVANRSCTHKNTLGVSLLCFMTSCEAVEAGLSAGSVEELVFPDATLSQWGV